MRRFLLPLLFATLLVSLCGCGAVTAPAGQSTGTGQSSLPLPEMGSISIHPTLPHALSQEDPPPQTSAAKAVLAELTTEEKVAQLFLAHFPGITFSEDSGTPYPGGYLFFSGYFADHTPDSLREAVEEMQARASVPLLLAVDEEGGTVLRVSRHSAFGHAPFQSPNSLYLLGGYEALAQDAAEKSEFLLDLGLNVNLGPVCDVSTHQTDYIYPRTLGLGAEETAEYIRCVVEAMDQAGIGSALKHFPGYGGNSDTHTASSQDSRTLAALEERDLLPFQAGIDAGADAVMVSHNIVTALDGESPASLSPAVYRYLRQEMGFSGVALCDDLSMAAISNRYDSAQAAVSAILAGCDLICTGDFASQYEGVLQAVRGGQITAERLDQSVLRVLEWKETLGLLESNPN